MSKKKNTFFIVTGVMLLVLTTNVFAVKTDYIGGYLGGGISFLSFKNADTGLSESTYGLSISTWGPFAANSFGYSVNLDISSLYDNLLMLFMADVGFYFPKKSVYVIYLGGGGGYVEIPSGSSEDIKIPFAEVSGEVVWQIGKTLAINAGFSYGFGTFTLSDFRVGVGYAY